MLMLIDFTYVENNKMAFSALHWQRGLSLPNITMELYLMFNPIKTGFSLKDVMLKAVGSLNDGAVLLLPRWT